MPDLADAIDAEVGIEHARHLDPERAVLRIHPAWAALSG
jgi:hypothetical protein